MTRATPRHGHQTISPVGALLEGPPLASQPRAFLDRFSRHARMTPDARALTPWGQAETGTSYGDLYSAAQRHAAGLVHLGLTGKPVVLSLPTGFEFASAFIGCLMAGVYAIPVSRPQMPVHKERFKHILRSLAPDAMVVGDVSDTGAKGIDLDQLDGAAVEIADPQDGDIAFLQFGSGSTGSPRGIAVSHANLAANMVQIEQLFCAGNARRSVTWLPHFHDMGLIGSILVPLARGEEIVQITPERFLRNPAEWLRAIAAGGTTTSGGPLFGYDHCLSRIRDGAVDDLDLSNWELAFCGAEPIRPSVLRGFVDRFSAQGFDASALLPCYGLAEATLLVSAGPWVETSPGTSVPVGNAAPGTRIKLRAHPDAPAGTGEICVAGPQVTTRCWSHDKHDVVPLPQHEEDGEWLATGDAGRISDNALVIVDRLKDVVILNGMNIAAAEVEAIAAQEASGAMAAFGAGEPERLCIVIEMRRAALRNQEDQALSKAISRRVWTDLGLAATLRVVAAGQLPRTTSGKIRRHSVKEAFLHGQYDLQSEVT